jgi:hypothetical protein
MIPPLTVHKRYFITISSPGVGLFPLLGPAGLAGRAGYDILRGEVERRKESIPWHRLVHHLRRILLGRLLTNT